MQEDIQKAIANNELYAIGESVPEDWKPAFDIWLSLAKQGDAKAQFNIGYMFARGDIMERDPAKAFEWYQKAADNNDPRAHYNLSKLYEIGEGVLQNTAKAQEHMAKATELGDDRAKIKVALAHAKEALKLGDREKARAQFASIASNNKEAEMGIIACSAVFKSVYSVSIVYSYHSSGTGNNKKFWKWAESVKTEVNLNMTNQSTHSWQVMVKALIRGEDNFVNISSLGGLLRGGETQSNAVDLEKHGDAYVCGVAVYSDREGSVDKPIYSFHFPDVPLKPDEEETKSLPHKVMQAQSEMVRHNKTAQPSACFVLTACYGSYDAPTVYAFRQFRDKHLAQHALGKRLIKWYYTYGPGWAAAIENKPRVKAVFRAVFNQIAKILPE